MSILANLQNINLSFGEKIIFDDAAFTISDGDRIGLIGLNGMGKSTLLKIISDNIIPDQSNPSFVFDKNKELSISYIPQEINIENFQDLGAENFYLAFHPELYQLHQKLSEVEQQLSTNFDNESLLYKQDEYHQKINQHHGWTISQSYLSILKRYNFNFERKINQLSGGELKKLSLAAGLSSLSSLILWDEPTNHLDLETIEKFEDDVQGQGRAFVMISHDRYMLSNICNKIMHIHNGKINLFHGNYIQYLEYLEEQEVERQKQLDKAQNRHRRELAWMRQGIKARGTRSKKRVESFHNIESDIQSLKSQTKKIVNLSLEHSGRKSKKLVHISKGEFFYKQNKIFEDLNISLFKNDKVALVGLNGQGKTTLVKVITEELQLQNGDFFIADKLKINVFAQNRDALNENKTPFEIIGDGQDFVHMPDGRNLHVNSYLENFLFQSGQVRRPISTLSGGEKNRLQLALFMKEACDLWIFDEPTNDLDIETIEVLERMLKDYKSAVIIISHDRAFLDNIVNKSWVINQRQIETFEGGYTKIAPYLHAIELEQELNEIPKNDAIKENNVNEEIEQERMTNKEKMRWKVIEKEIADAEVQLDEYTSKLAQFDFTDMNDDKNALYEELHNGQKKWENTLERLYEKWDDLSHKKP